MWKEKEMGCQFQTRSFYDYRRSTFRNKATHLAVILVVTASACSGLGGLDHPSVTEEEIGVDIVGRNTGEGLLSWVFEKDEPREIAILEADYLGDQATIVINMLTETAPGSSSRHKMAGKLRLHYEWVADEWALLRVENLDFKERE